MGGVGVGVQGGRCSGGESGVVRGFGGRGEIPLLTEAKRYRASLGGSRYYLL